MQRGHETSRLNLPGSNRGDADPAYTNDAAHVADGALASGPIYEDASFKYFGDAIPGSSLTASVWRVSRLSNSTSQLEWADGDGKFDNVFTDLSTVAALDYS